MIKTVIKTKICTKCGREKPLSEFHKTSRKYKLKNESIKTYYYHHAKCSVCRCIEKNEWHRERGKGLKDIKFNLDDSDIKKYAKAVIG